MDEDDFEVTGLEFFPFIAKQSLCACAHAIFINWVQCCMQLNHIII